MPETVLAKLQRVAEQAKRYPDKGIWSLAHLIDPDFLMHAFRRTNPKSTPGIDGETWKSYEENLEGNIRDLHERMKTMRYRAQPVKRVWLEKEDGKKRPIGKPVIEDKIAQRAVTMILEAIYEQDFTTSPMAFDEVGDRKMHCTSARGATSFESRA